MHVLVDSSIHLQLKLGLLCQFSISVWRVLHQFHVIRTNTDTVQKGRRRLCFEHQNYEDVLYLAVRIGRVVSTRHLLIRAVVLVEIQPFAGQRCSRLDIR